MVSPAFLIPSSCICGSGMTGYITAGLEYKQKPFYMSVITQQNAGLLIRCENIFNFDAANYAISPGYYFA